jgi:hypothetical protein
MTTDEHDNLSDEELAAVSEYENSEEGRAGAPEPESHAERLTRLFYKTAEMQECRQTADSINNRLNPEDTVAVQIDVPREFIRLTEFLEQKRATAAGVEPLPPPQVLNQIVLNELHDQLHWLVVEPAHFSHYRELWNRFCDEQGSPQQKISGQTSGQEGGREGPF